MIEGIYSISFRGYADWGMGLLLLQRGVITGADGGGATYDGRYSEVDKDGVVSAEIRMTVPAGLSLVQGTPPQPEPYTIDFRAEIPVQALETDDTVVQIDMPPGPVNVIFRRLRSLEA